MGKRKIKRRIANLEARIERLESGRWDPADHIDVSGEPVDAGQLWRQANSDYAHGRDDEDWRYL